MQKTYTRKCVLKPNHKVLKAYLCSLLSLFLLTNGILAQRQMERLNRGVVAVRKSNSHVYIGWRLLANDPPDISFNVYNANTKLNATPIANTTNFVDSVSVGTTYTTKPVLNGIEQSTAESAQVINQP